MNIFRMGLAGFLGMTVLTAATCADTRTAASASYDDVSAAVSATSSGDTVKVPAGSATWNSVLTITKGIILQGAGVGKTVITSNITDQNGGIIKYAPASAAANEPFRITGFTFDADEKSNGIVLINPTAQIINKIRIDHNRVIKPGGRNAGRCIVIHGTVYGVIDNNVVESGTGKAIDSYGSGNDIEWKNLTRDFGNENNIYFEDNTLISNNTYHSAGHGGRYVTRYNDYSGTARNLFPIFDMHGNQSAGYGTMVGEVYGNKIDLGTYGGGLLDQRGGQALVFFNKVTAGGSVSTKVRDEFDDATIPAPNTFLMHVTNSYYWNNRANNKLISPFIQHDIPNERDKYNGCNLAENVDFWTQQDKFDGTKGMGCGPLKDRPETCVPGVAYWATEQSCDTVSDDHVGAHPKKPIVGTFYQCTAPNTWTAYYTPYPYPHPLRVSGPLADPPKRQ